MNSFEEENLSESSSSSSNDEEKIEIGSAPIIMMDTLHAYLRLAECYISCVYRIVNSNRIRGSAKTRATRVFWQRLNSIIPSANAKNFKRKRFQFRSLSLANAMSILANAEYIGEAIDAENKKGGLYLKGVKIGRLSTLIDRILCQLDAVSTEEEIKEIETSVTEAMKLCRREEKSDMKSQTSLYVHLILYHWSYYAKFTIENGLQLSDFSNHGAEHLNRVLKKSIRQNSGITRASAATAAAAKGKPELLPRKHALAKVLTMHNKNVARFIPKIVQKKPRKATRAKVETQKKKK